MTALTERRAADRRAADRIKLAAIVKAVCDKHGATCELLTEGRMIRCEIAIRGVSAGIEFDGGADAALLDNYCVPWNSDKRLSYGFEAAAGTSVNPHHRRKCTAFCHGSQALESHLNKVLGLIAVGMAFEPWPESVPVRPFNPEVYRK